MAAFAALTGDRSSLHVSDDFARRSAYRRPVVHGMLPIGFLCLLPTCRIEGYRVTPLALSGRFTAPVHAGDALTLTAGPGRIAEGQPEMTLDFEVRHDASGTVVTNGSLTVAYDRELVATHPAPGATEGRGMLVESTDPSTRQLEQIEKGMRDHFSFRISATAVHAFLELLAQGWEEGDAARVAAVSERFDLPSLMAVLLFSTSVGVSLPGTLATFLEFTARLERPVELDTMYRLAGEVVHRSRATRIVKKSLAIHAAERSDVVALRGKVAALVQEPARPMPTVTDLRASATDWGLAGKVALITGASRGIGETTAKLLALAGARVVVNYHRGKTDAERVAGEIRAAGGDAVAIAADVSDPDAVRALIRAAQDRYGTIHVLVNNAARDFRPIPFLQLTWEEIQRDLDVIAKGAFLCCREVIPLMLQQGGGKIVNISSVATDDPPPGQAKYVMAKSALVGLTRSLSIELAAKNIQVNMVVPNFVDTDLVAHVPEGFRRKIARETPMGRLAAAAEVAQAVLFLASPHASFTTGQKLLVTGGGAPYL